MTGKNMIFWACKVPDKQREAMWISAQCTAGAIINLMPGREREFLRIAEALLENEVEHLRMNQANCAAFGGRLGDLSTASSQQAAGDSSRLLGDCGVGGGI
jgi:hypothetical protein